MFAKCFSCLVRSFCSSYWLILLMITFTGNIRGLLNEGMPNLRLHTRGNLYVKFDVVFPDKFKSPRADFFDVSNYPQNPFQ